MTEAQVAELLALLGRIATALEAEPPVVTTLPTPLAGIPGERPQDLTNMTAYVEIPLKKKRPQQHGRL